MDRFHWMYRASSFSVLAALAAMLLSPVGAQRVSAAGEPGSLDPTFGEGGKVTTGFGTGARAWGVALQSDGRIVVAGSSGYGYETDFALARYNPDGSLDTTFGDGGRVITDFGRAEEALDVAIAGDGKIVLAGGSGAYGIGSDFALARYNPDGSLDTAFGTGGLVLTDWGVGSTYAYALAIATDGRVVAAGSDTADFVLARYNLDGSLDTTFGDGGRVRTGFAGGGPDGAIAAALQPDGKIVAAGISSMNWSGNAFVLARYNLDGSLDTTFGDGGRVLTALPTDGAYAVAVQGDGRIIAAGGVGGDFGLIRYNPDGSLDAAFGDGGRVATDMGGDEVLYALAIAAEGRILGAGSSRRGGLDFALSRYLPNGRLDSSFGNDGIVLSEFGGGDEIHALAVQADGNIVAAGTTTGIDSSFALARYTGGAASDTTPPVLSGVPADITAEATSAAGTVVTYDTPAASDPDDAAGPVSCTPASGSMFPLDQSTAVTCSSTDTHGNTGSASFTVTVVDTTAPTFYDFGLPMPDWMIVQAYEPGGAWAFTQPVFCPSLCAVDVVDGDIEVTFSQTGLFPIGTTLVTLSATDAHGNTATHQFTFTVLGAPEQLGYLDTSISSANLAKGTTSALREPLDAALRHIASGKPVSACGDLQDFIGLVRAQSGKKVPAAAASQFIEDATRIMAVLGCKTG